MRESLNRRGVVLACLCLSGWCLPRASGQAIDQGIEVDKEHQEIRFPCRFINPSQVIEVFGCHRSGPTHETVVEFDATGPEIHQALLAIGCRPASYWNAASPKDFSRNQGDRLLVLVRWRHRGEEKEYPAEGMLLDGETGFPMFLRGFSFGARTGLRPKPPAAEEGSPVEGARDGPRGENGGEPAPGEIPLAVEITLGATNRQSPTYSLLSHPTCAERFQRYVLPPVVDRSVVEDLEGLIVDEAPATLIIRRLPSEAALIDQARALAERRGLSERALLLAGLRPIAVEIDRRKGEYEALRRELEASIGAPPQAPPQAPEGGRDPALRVLELLRRGVLLSAAIEERYLELWSREEEHKAAWIEKRTELPVEVRGLAATLARNGIPVELAAARKELELLPLALRDGALGETQGFKTRALEREIEGLRLDQEAVFAAWELAEAKRRRAAADDPYVRKLFGEDEARGEWRLRAITAKKRLVATLAAESQARAEGRWAEIEAATLKARRRAESEIALSRLEEQMLEIEEEVRWEEGDAASEFPERRAEAKEKLKELNARRRALEEKIEAARKELGAQG